MSKDVYERRTKEVMSRDLVTIDAKESVHVALQLMAENKVAALPVVDRSGTCIGVLSSSDLVEVTRDMEAGLSELEKTEGPLWEAYLGRIGESVGHQSVLELMSNSVVSVNPETPIFEAASKMLREHVHRMPVVDGEDRLLGIVSMTDILTAFVECAPVKPGA